MAIDPCLAPLLPKFKQSCIDVIQSIKESLEQDDFDTARRMAHNLKGQGGMFGFANVTDAAKDMEDAALSGDKDDALVKYAALSTLIDSVIQEIDAAL